MTECEMRDEIERLQAENARLKALRPEGSRTGALVEFAARLCAKGLQKGLTIRVPPDEWFNWLREGVELRRYGVKRDANALFEVMEMYGPGGMLLRVESDR